MTEGDLNKIPINDLFDLMIKKTQELIDFNTLKNEIEHEAKKEELQLIQRVIIAKTTEFSPLAAYISRRNLGVISW